MPRRVDVRHERVLEQAEAVPDRRDAVRLDYGLWLVHELQASEARREDAATGAVARVHQRVLRKHAGQDPFRTARGKRVPEHERVPSAHPYEPVPGQVGGESFGRAEVIAEVELFGIHTELRESLELALDALVPDVVGSSVDRVGDHRRRPGSVDELEQPLRVIAHAE